MAEKPTHEELEQRIQALEKTVLKQKHAEASIGENEEKFKRSSWMRPCLIKALDGNGDLAEVNQNFIDALGNTREEVIGMNFGDSLHPDWVVHFKAAQLPVAFCCQHR